MKPAQHDTEAVFCLAQFQYFTQFNQKSRRNVGYPGWKRHRCQNEANPCQERAEAAVIAWMRHQTTAYETMKIARIKGGRRQVRRTARGLTSTPRTPLAGTVSGVFLLESASIRMVRRMVANHLP